MQEKMRTTEKAQKNEVPGHGGAPGHTESYWDHYKEVIFSKGRCAEQRQDVQSVGWGIK